MASGARDFFLGSPGQVKQVSKFNQPQVDILNQLSQMGLQGFQNPFQGFQPIADEARAGFSQKTLPLLAERFSSMGQNRLSSPAFRSQQLGAATDLERSLAAMQAQFGQQNQMNMLKALGLGLTPQWENMAIPAQQGFLQQLAGNAAQAAGTYGPMALAAMSGGAYPGGSAASGSWLKNFTTMLGAMGGR